MIKLLGIPFDANSSFLQGPANAPQAIRKMHLENAANAYSESGKALTFNENIIDLDDLEFSSDDGQQAYEIIHDKVESVVVDGSKLICLGGDHSVTFPIVAAFATAYPELHILHFDAHADIYDSYDNNYYSHGSPFARIMENKLAETITQVGIRTLTDHQLVQAENFGIKIIEMRDFSMDFLKMLKGPLYLSFDLDVLDPAFAPGVSHHEPGGMTVRQVLDCIQQIEVEVVGADIVELNPDRDLYDMSAMVAYKILKEIWALM